MQYNIDTMAELTPEQQAAWMQALLKAVAENRSINTYATKQYGDPKRQEKHLQEQQNIMRLGLPATTDMWGDLDPEIELNNKVYSTPLAIGEVVGYNSPRTPEYNQHAPAMSINYDRIGSAALMDLINQGLPATEYTKEYQDYVKRVFDHESSHTWGMRRIPFGHPEEIVTKFWQGLPQKEKDTIPNTITSGLEAIKATEPVLADIYLNALQKNPSQALGLFDEVSARYHEGGLKDLIKGDSKNLLDKYLRWKKLGIWD